MFQKNVPLANLTTFHIPAKAAIYAEYSSIKELLAISRTPEFCDNEIFNIGEGSNLLFTSDFNGLVLHSAIKGIKRYDKDSDNIFLIAGAGEKWGDVVNFALSENLGGIENLAGIPGSMGAAAVQNIGAYGLEIAQRIHRVECFDTVSRETVSFSAEECGYGYRDSKFKNEWKGRYIVTRVSLKLFNSTIATITEYSPLDKLKGENNRVPTIHEVAAEVIKARDSKLPYPDKYGNAGSFFKNPVVHRYFYDEFVKSFSDNVPYYPTENPDFIKISAAWLIDKAGLKGCTIGDAEVWPSQPLVIVNKGNATAHDVKLLMHKIINEVREKFGIILYPEVNLISTEIKVTVLGSGTSKGVPEVGCRCQTCLSSDSHDKRLRSSVLIETQGIKILIDPSPDFRQQALSMDLYHLDATLITHSHYDHVGGLDDLRPFCARGKFPIFLKEDVNNDIRRRIDYCFKAELYPGVPSFETNVIDNKPFYIKGVKIIPITVYHGKLPILGFRIGDFAYITDAKTIPEVELEKLKGLKVLIINALRHRHHFAHLSIEEAIDIIKEINPEKAYLTHFNHEVGLHSELEKSLPPNIYPCYDGLTIRL